MQKQHLDAYHLLAFIPAERSKISRTDLFETTYNLERALGNGLRLPFFTTFRVTRLGENLFASRELQEELASLIGIGLVKETTGGGASEQPLLDIEPIQDISDFIKGDYLFALSRRGNENPGGAVQALGDAVADALE